MQTINARSISSKWALALWGEQEHMASVKCKNCNQDISPKAPTCPACGHPNKQANNLSVGQALIGLIAGLGGIWYMASNNSGSDPTAPLSQFAQTAPPTGPALPVSTLQLFDDYHANEVAADNQYKGKLLEVSGVVSSINKDLTDSVYLALRTPNQFMEIHAELQKQDVQKAARLAKGTKVVVICQGNGMIVGSVMLNDCALK